MSRWVKYAEQFPAMIRSWREAWAAGTGQEELLKAPFGFVQVSTDFATLCTVHVLLVPGEATLVYFI